MLEFMIVIKALADENRVRALLALRTHELCVCQITELLGLAPSTVSKHMSILKQARLVDSRKNGRWIYYRLADNDVPPDASEALAWVRKALSDDSQTREDDVHLEQILKLAPEVLCKRQAKT
jgi:ArsR family transcriptional regulator, arsenate/arsenite/antimonite-responsive transcriptional repressor